MLAFKEGAHLHWLHLFQFSPLCCDLVSLVGRGGIGLGRAGGTFCPLCVLLKWLAYYDAYIYAYAYLHWFLHCDVTLCLLSGEGGLGWGGLG